jgi:hypothetical protein
MKRLGRINKQWPRFYGQMVEFESLPHFFSEVNIALTNHRLSLMASDVDIVHYLLLKDEEEIIEERKFD